GGGTQPPPTAWSPVPPSCDNDCFYPPTPPDGATAPATRRSRAQASTGDCFATNPVAGAPARGAADQVPAWDEREQCAGVDGQQVTPIRFIANQRSDVAARETSRW